MLYLVRYLFIFTIIVFTLFFSFKALMTTTYFKSSANRRKVLINTVLIIGSALSGLILLSLYMSYVE